MITQADAKSLFWTAMSQNRDTHIDRQANRLKLLILYQVGFLFRVHLFPFVS